MDLQSLFTERRIAGSLLILCGIVFAIGGYLYAGRAIWKWTAGESEIYLRWERGIIIAAVLMSVLGFALLENLLHNSGETLFSRIGLVIFLISATTIAVAETAYLNNRTWVYPQIVFHVVLAFLAQAAFGAALLRTGLLASWVGWATILWNLGCLIVVPILFPNDIYFPWLHYAAPLIIGIALLAG